MQSSGSATDVDISSLDTPVATVDIDAVETSAAHLGRQQREANVGMNFRLEELMLFFRF